MTEREHAVYGHHSRHWTMRAGGGVSISEQPRRKTNSRLGEQAVDAIVVAVRARAAAHRRDRSIAGAHRTEDVMTLIWKDCGDGRWDAAAASFRDTLRCIQVGGEYVIENIKIRSAGRSQRDQNAR